MPGLAEPGLAPDTPVCAQAVATAREGVGAAICAARAIVSGARFSYALCRPPGHHAGPGWLGGYCYLNNAAAAAQALHDGGLAQIAILDIDLHYPNGTSALLERMTSTTLHSLHGSTGANLPWERVRPRTDREHLVAFRSAPASETYLAALARCTQTLARSTDAIVLSLGYDLVEGDPHGTWSFRAPVFERIGRLLARTGLPVCVVQEGGYALESLAQCSHAFASGLLERRRPVSGGRFQHSREAVPDADLLIVGAGAKATAIAAKVHVINRLGLGPIALTIVEASEPAASWSGRNGMTSGEEPLAIPPIKDVGFPYQSHREFGDEIGEEIDRAMMPLTWQQYMICERRYVRWVNAGSPPIQHRTYGKYLAWVLSRATEGVRLVHGRVTRVSLEQGGPVEGAALEQEAPAEEALGEGELAARALGEGARRWRIDVEDCTDSPVYRGARWR